MANRRKNLTISERLEYLENEIAAKEAELKTLRTQKKELLEQKKMEDMEELYRMISESGKTIEDVRNILLSQNS